MPRLAPRSKPSAVGQRDRLVRGQRADSAAVPELALPGREVEPHPLADAPGVDALADGLDHAGAVLVGHLEGQADERAGPASAPSSRSG